MMKISEVVGGQGKDMGEEGRKSAPWEDGHAPSTGRVQHTDDQNLPYQLASKSFSHPPSRANIQVLEANCSHLVLFQVLVQRSGVGQTCGLAQHCIGVNDGAGGKAHKNVVGRKSCLQLQPKATALLCPDFFHRSSGSLYCSLH